MEIEKKMFAIAKRVIRATKICWMEIRLNFLLDRASFPAPLRICFEVFSFEANALGTMPLLCKRNNVHLLHLFLAVFEF